MSELSISDAWGRLNNIESEFNRVKANLHNNQSQKGPSQYINTQHQNSYGNPIQQNYAPRPQTSAYVSFGKNIQPIPPAAGQLKAILRNVQSLGTEVNGALQKETNNLVAYNNSAKKHQYKEAEAAMLKKSSNIKAAIEQCKKILQKINTISQETRRLMSLGPTDIKFQGSSIDTIVGSDNQSDNLSSSNVLNEVLYQLNKNIDYLIRGPVEPNLDKKKTTKYRAPWDKVVYGGGYLDYLATSKYYVNSSDNVRKMVNAARNMQSRDGMYAVGKSYHNT